MVYQELEKEYDKIMSKNKDLREKIIELKGEYERTKGYGYYAMLQEQKAKLEEQIKNLKIQEGETANKLKIGIYDGLVDRINKLEKKIEEEKPKNDSLQIRIIRQKAKKVLDILDEFKKSIQALITKINLKLQENLDLTYIVRLKDLKTKLSEKLEILNSLNLDQIHIADEYLSKIFEINEKIENSYNEELIDRQYAQKARKREEKIYIEKKNTYEKRATLNKKILEPIPTIEELRHMDSLEEINNQVSAYKMTADAIKDTDPNYKTLRDELEQRNEKRLELILMFLANYLDNFHNKLSKNMFSSRTRKIETEEFEEFLEKINALISEELIVINQKSSTRIVMIKILERLYELDLLEKVQKEKMQCLKYTRNLLKSDDKMKDSLKGKINLYLYIQKTIEMTGEENRVNLKEKAHELRKDIISFIIKIVCKDEYSNNDKENINLYFDFAEKNQIYGITKSQVLELVNGFRKKMEGYKLTYENYDILQRLCQSLTVDKIEEIANLLNDAKEYINDDIKVEPEEQIENTPVVTNQFFNMFLDYKYEDYENMLECMDVCIKVKRIMNKHKIDENLSQKILDKQKSIIYEITANMIEMMATKKVKLFGKVYSRYEEICISKYMDEFCNELEFDIVIEDKDGDKTSFALINNIEQDYLPKLLKKCQKGKITKNEWKKFEYIKKLLNLKQFNAERDFKEVYEPMKEIRKVMEQKERKYAAQKTKRIGRLSIFNWIFRGKKLMLPETTNNHNESPDNNNTFKTGVKSPTNSNVALRGIDPNTGLMIGGVPSAKDRDDNDRNRTK